MEAIVDLTKIQLLCLQSCNLKSLHKILHECNSPFQLKQSAICNKIVVVTTVGNIQQDHRDKMWLVWCKGECEPSANSVSMAAHSNLAAGSLQH